MNKGNPFKKERKVSKAKVIAISLVAAFAIIGIACFVFGYGLSEGWEVVLAWFSSKWATMVYLIILIVAVVSIWIFHYLKVKKAIGNE